MTARTAAYWLLFSFTRNLCEKTDLFRVALSMTFDFEKWDKPMVMGKFLELYSSELVSAGFETYVDSENLDSGMWLDIIFHSKDHKV